jgi:hypothetical protein
VAIRPFEIQAVASYEVIALQLMAAGFDLLGRPITPPHHVGFAVADGTRAGLTEFFERQKLLYSI